MRQETQTKESVIPLSSEILNNNLRKEREEVAWCFLGICSDQGRRSESPDTIQPQKNAIFHPVYTLNPNSVCRDRGYGDLLSYDYRTGHLDCEAASLDSDSVCRGNMSFYGGKCGEWQRFNPR